MNVFWGTIRVPHTTLWSGEDQFEIRPCPYANGREALWQPDRQGHGKPVFSKPHSVRQRRAMALQLCDVCGRPLKGSTKVSLSQERFVEVPSLGIVPLALEAMSHKKCAALALAQCPSLKRQQADGSLRIRQVSRCLLIAQELTGEATMEFAGVFKPHTVGHLKMAITASIDRDPEWLAATDRAGGAG